MKRLLPFSLLLHVMVVGIVPAKASDVLSKDDSLTCREVVEQIKQHVTCSWNEGKTVDTFKAGNPDEKVTGIVTTMFATMDVLREAVKQNCNFIIAHEPLFYNHLDETDFQKNDPVYLEKLKYINDHHLVVWRFHDHWHRTSPDGIYVGMVRKLGWAKYRKGDSYMVFEFPETTLKDLAEHLKQKFPQGVIRVVGDPGMKLTGVALAVGAPGADRQRQLLNRDDVQVVITGEAREWETPEYALDATQQGRSKAFIMMGHVLSEQAGMDYCAEWLGGFISGLPIKFIPNKQPYWTPQ
ncbi:Nif3-like dinuclear metal center hexameric protein [Prolixibacter denitrificans]|nr:Nif3-like dinuclear metal center hexameric protein [Prolixibacter denitrificans]PSK81776.1 putative NIF3 family GTP cyclohydrolase 1 type 2 [Prolixibacter denitrificans]